MDSKPSTINISDVNGGDINIGNLVTGSVAGDIVHGDKVRNNITNIVNCALSAVTEAERARTYAIKRLAEGVKDYAQRLRAVVIDETHADQAGPYKGLLAYSLEDAKLFFGRKRAIIEFLPHVLRGRLTILQAESGAGKTSLLRAGISPYLLELESLPVWLRPYDISPGLAVKQAFVPNVTKIEELEQRSLRDYLRKVTTILGQSTPLYLLLDQFEEFFTVLDKTVRAAFVSELAECLEDETLNVHWVLALRSEFFGDLAHFRPRIRNPFENYYRLDHLSPSEARQAIIEPAQYQGIDIESALVEAMLTDLCSGEQAISPPQIQLVCSALYDLLMEHRAKNPDAPLVINHQMYNDEGQAQGILSGYLSRVLRRTLSKPERELARQLLIALVSFDQRRIRRTRSELAATLATYIVGAQSLDQLLDQLVDSRLLTVEKDEESDEACYELAHDYLVAKIELDPEVRAQKAAQELLTAEVKSYKLFGTLLDEDKFNIINSQRDFLNLDEIGEELLDLSQERHKAEQQRELEQQRALAEKQRELAEEAEARRQAEAERAEEHKEAATKLRKRAMWLAAAGVIAILLATTAGIFARQAEIKATESESLAIAANAQGALSDNNTDLAIALALEAVKKGEEIGIPPAQAQKALADAAYFTFGTKRIFEGHTDDVTGVAFSPDGFTIVSASDDDTLRLWNIETGAEIRRFEGHTDDVTGVAFSPDGLTIVSASDDDTLRLWNIETGAEIRRFEGHTDDVLSVAFSADGRRIVSGSADDSVRLWNVETGAEIHHFKGHTDDVTGVALSSNGQFIVSGSLDKSLRLWDVETGAEIRQLLGHSHGVQSVAFSPDDRTIVSGAGEYQLRSWDINGNPLRLLTGHQGRAGSVAFNQDGSSAISGSYDSTLILWDVSSGTAIQRFIGHSGEVTSVAFSPDGETVVSGATDRTLRLWDIASGAEIRRMMGYVGMAVAENSNTFVAAKGNVWLTDFTVFDAATLKPIADFSEDSWLISLASSPDGKAVFAGYEDGHISYWREDGTRQLRLEGHPGRVTSIASSQDGCTAISGSYGPAGWPSYEVRDDLLLVWDLETGEIKRRLVGHDRIVRSVAMSNDGKTALSASDDGTVRVWDVTHGEERQKFAGHFGSVNAVVFGPNEQTALSASRDHTVRLWDIETGQEIRRFIGHSGPVSSVALSPDGQTVLSGSEDLTIRMWNLETGVEIGRFSGHAQAIRKVAFGADGLSALSYAWDNTIRIWTLEPPKDLVNWTYEHRYVPELSCAERQQYGVKPYCDVDNNR